MSTNLLGIGQFSRMSRMTVKALRYYDEQGVLKPAYIDSASGYRYYSTAQLAEANMIRNLRSLEFSLEDIKRFLGETDTGVRHALLEAHRGKIENRLEQYKSIITTIEKTIEGKEEIMEAKMEIKELAGQPIVSLRFKTSLPNIGESLGRVFASIFAYLGKTVETPAGPPFAIYHDEEFKEEDMDIEVCASTSTLLTGEGEVKSRELSGVTVASTLHMGPYDDSGEVWQALFAWLTEQGYRPSGPPREIFFVGPQPGKDSSEYRSEFLYPVTANET